MGTGKIYKHPQYYFLGHFSKFILPGSTLLHVKVLGSRQYHGAIRPYGTCTGDDGIEASAFLRPDGATAIIVLNCGPGAVDFQIHHDRYIANVNIPAHAIQTYLLHTAASDTLSTNGRDEFV